MSMETFDVMVIGAGAAGLCAAVQAGRAGAETILVEKNGICGGTITMSGVNYPGIFQAWGRQVIGGIGWELVQKTLEEAGWPLPDFREFDAEHHWRNQIRIDAVVFAALADRMPHERPIRLAADSSEVDLPARPLVAPRCFFRHAAMMPRARS